MGLASASSFLVLAGVKNRVVRQIRRLRQPRYLVATLAGLFYFWSVFIRRVTFTSAAQGRWISDEGWAVAESILIVVGFVLVLGGWVFGKDDASLTFNESEIQFLFPAPASRRMLLHYKLARSHLRTFFGAVLSAL